MNNRASDRVGKWGVVGFFVVLAIVFFLRWKADLGDLPFMVGLVIAAGLLSPTFVLDAIRRWRGNAGGGDDAAAG